MPASSVRQRQGNPSWRVRFAQRLWKLLGFLGTAVLLSLVVNVFSTWLTSSQGQLPKDSPFAAIRGWLGMHWGLALVVGCFLLITAVLLWFVSREHLALPRMPVLYPGTLRRYLTYFHYEHRDLDMKGISTRGTYTLDVEQIYVDVRIDPTPAHRAQLDPLQLPPALATGAHAIWDYLTQLDQHLVILGAPGSGKTTLLKHLGLRLAQLHWWQRRSQARLRWKIPVFLSLREQSTQVQNHPAYTLSDAICQQIHKWRQPLPVAWIERLLHNGHGLILLDGLDEIANPTERQQMIEWVQQQMVAYGGNRFVITSRPLGYQNNPLEHVAVLAVQPFSLEQVTQFLQGWYLANEIKRAMRDDPGVRMKAREGAEDLLHRLHETAALFALVVNPLLLTMVATVHLYYGTLPGARITLYKAICEVFLSRRKVVPGSPQELRAEQRQLALQPLAYTLMQQGQRDILRADACQLLTAPLQAIGTTITPDLFLDHLEALTSGLFLERESGVYSFAHKTFQEYLAMIHLQKEPILVQELLTHVGDSWWHETIRLYCAQADATPILNACLAQSLHSLGALTLAIDCAEEALTLQTTVKERLYQLLEQGVNDPDSTRRSIIAEALLQRRLRQMRPLLEKTFIATSLITCAEYQLFLDEQTASNHTPDIWSTHTFPEGQGGRVLVGVRSADAQAFCDWLTERDREGYIYRLPKREEYALIRSRIGKEFPIDTGYWNERGWIEWPQLALSRSFVQQILDVSGADANASASAHAHDFALARASALAHDFASDRDRAHELTSAHDLARILAHELTSALASTSAHYLARILARDRASDLARDLARDLASARDLARILASDFASDFARARDLARILARALARASDLARILASDLASDLASALASTLVLSVLLFLLARPTGASPAYEGLLLIKEPRMNASAI